SAPAELVQRSAGPFGLAASLLTSGGLRDKWLDLQRRLDDEMVQLALCEGDRDGCASPAALKFLDIVDAARLREGRARLGEINRAINLAIRPVSDLAQHGVMRYADSSLLVDASGWKPASFARHELSGRLRGAVLRIRRVMIDGAQILRGDSRQQSAFLA